MRLRLLHLGTITIGSIIVASHGRLFFNRYSSFLIPLPFHLQTHFEHLNANEGADLGQVVDIVVPSFGQDITKQLEFLLSTTYYEKVDTVLVQLLNNILGCTKGTREDILNTVQVMEMTQDIIKDLIL